MDLIISRGVRFSYLLIPRSSKCFSKLPLFLNKQNKVTTCWLVHYSGKQPLSSCQSNETSLLTDRWHGQLKFLTPDSYPLKAYTASYCSSTKSDSSTKTEVPDKQCTDKKTEKPSVFQRMKQMTKDYWHILIPVHIVTSIGWTSIFYIAAKNGVDIIGILESLHMSEKYLEMIRGSNAGNWAVTYALYKIFTPIRYTVTLGGTTMCIRYLNKWGYMKFKDSKLKQSLKSAQENITSYGKSKISSKVNQPPPKS